MPELPEVETVVRTLRPSALDRKIAGVTLRRAEVLRPAGFDLPGHLIGQSIAAIGRRGKKILFTLDNGQQFCIHLGMSGQLSAEDAGAAIKSHTHLLIDLASTPSGGLRQIRFRDPRRFGGIWWLGAAGQFDAGLGPEPMEISAGELAARLAGTRRAIKSALLDQRLIAGLGNIYVDESLFAARIHPLTPANRLLPEQIRRLTVAIKRILSRAIEHRGSTLRDYRDANGDAGSFAARHQVYHRDGKPCRRCKSEITRIVLGGRGTHFCPYCQRKVRQKAIGRRR